MTGEDKSFRLKYVGTRFDETRLPVEVLSDLPAFRDLLVAFAKDEWRNLNADRKRVPKGFDKSISLDLVAIEPGSAVPKLDWNRINAQANLPGFSDQLEEVVDQSFKDVVDLIDGAGNDRFPKSLSSEHVRALNRLGSGLRDKERIEFVGTQGSDGNVVFLDTYRRKQLITRVRETYQARFESVGTLLGAVVADFTGHIIVQTAEHGNIQIPLDRDRVINEFDGNIESDVQFDLQIELDNSDRYRSIVEVFDVVLIDAHIGADLEKCRTRLNEIRSLEAGWHDGAGAAIDTSAVDAANRFLSMRPSLAGTYRIYPTEARGVLFEFESNGWDFSIEFRSDGAVEMYGVQMTGDGEMEPHEFNEVGEAFMSEFDRRVGR